MAKSGQVPDLLAVPSIDWAKAHVARFGDGDVFPPPFEIEAILASWTTAKAWLEAVDLNHHAPRPSWVALVPKPGFGFRAAVRLDPLETFVYLAIGHELADKIENDRVPAERRIACSFRISPQPDGLLFPKRDGWNDFFERSKEEAEQCSHVVVADISDFYNQASHHRIENSLESAQVSELRAKNVEAYLGALRSAKTSKGLPVGPMTSILLAEACLNDVDRHLLTRGYVHTRYVDDYRIFCQSYREALGALHELSSYLYTAHRLALQGGKTAILRAGTFKKRELVDPEQEEDKGLRRELHDLLVDLMNETGYWFGDTSFDDLERDERSEIIRRNLKQLMKEALSQPTLPLGLTRYVLRRARVLRTACLYPLVVKELDKLVPVMRDVTLYFNDTLNGQRCSKYGKYFVGFLQGSDWNQVPYVAQWVLWLLAQHPALATFEEAADLAEGFGRRHTALLARSHRQVAWVRSQKEIWMNDGPWDRRAILWAGSILPQDERKAWLKNVAKQTTDPLERIVANHAALG